MSTILALLTNATFWTAVGALATVAAVFGLRYAGQQVRLEAWAKIVELFSKQEFVDARGRLFQRLDQPDIPWTEPQRQDALLVCRRMDELGHLARFYGTADIIEIFGDPIAKAWALLEPTVRSERLNTKWPQKWESFQSLGKEAVSFRTDAIERLAEVQKRTTTALPAQSHISQLPADGAT